MSQALKRVFLFSEKALAAGCSLDVMSGPDILLHIKPLPDRQAIIVNDHRGGVWGQELAIPVPSGACQGGLRVTLLCGPGGVEIAPAEEAPQGFARCGDLRDPALHFRHPAAVTECTEAPPRPAPARDPAAEREAARAALREAVRRAAWPEVIERGEAYRRAHGGSAEVTVWIGRARFSLGDFAGTVALLEPLPREAPEQHEGLFYLGTALARLQRFDRARDILLGCVAARPVEARYAFELARATARLVNGGYGVVPPRPDLLDEAIGLMQRAAVLMPRDGRPHRDLSGLLMQKGHLPEALAALEEAQRRSPSLSMLAIERARLLVRLDRIEEALEHARQAQAGDPGNDTAAAMVRVLERWQAGRQGGPFRVAVLPPAAGATAAP